MWDVITDLTFDIQYFSISVLILHLENISFHHTYSNAGPITSPALLQHKRLGYGVAIGLDNLIKCLFVMILLTNIC